MPYLLLAAFYFFGFAMGMFNNSTGDETTESVSAVTIPVEVKQKTADHTAFYYQITTVQTQIQADNLCLSESSPTFPPDTGSAIFKNRNLNVQEFYVLGFRFSRPPPVNC
jgi:hypothetical protein